MLHVLQLSQFESVCVTRLTTESICVTCVTKCGAGLDELLPETCLQFFQFATLTVSSVIVVCIVDPWIIVAVLPAGTVCVMLRMYYINAGMAPTATVPPMSPVNSARQITIKQHYRTHAASAKHRPHAVVTMEAHPMVWRALLAVSNPGKLIGVAPPRCVSGNYLF